MKVYLEENLETCYNKSENERFPLDLTRLIWSSRCDSFSASAESCKYFWELFIMSSAVLMSRASCLEETCLPKSENLQRNYQGMTMTWGYIFGMVFHHNLKKSNNKVKEKLTLEFLAFRPHMTSQAGSPEESIQHLGSWSVLGPLWSFLPEVFLNAFWSSAHFGPRSSFRTPPQIHIWQEWRATRYFVGDNVLLI